MTWRRIWLRGKFIVVFNITFLYFIYYYFLPRLLLVDPKRRLTSTEALNHPWFTRDPVVVQQARDLMRGERALADLKAIESSPNPIPLSPLNGKLR